MFKKRNKMLKTLTSIFIILSLQICAADKPNVIIILADDLGYGDVGYQGCKDIPTPHIDSLAKNGISFSAGYSAAPVCGPSRAGLLTGRYQNRFGYQDNLGPYGRKADTVLGTPIDTKTIADRFQEMGYHTGMIGKWHDGDEDKFWPRFHGFDETFCFNNGAANYFVGPENDTHDKWGAVHRNGKRVEKFDAYLTDAFGDEAVKFINKNKSKPFFLYLSFNAVHGPLQAPKEYTEKFKHLSPKKRQILAAMNWSMDVNIGKALKTLKENNIDENTLIFFLSDNGGKPNGNFSYNGPLRNMKGTTWEGGIRVPFCVQWKAQIKAGQRNDSAVHAIDIMSTAIAAVKTDIPKEWNLEGSDLLPLMTGKLNTLPDRHLFWRLNTNWAVRNSKWKLTGMNGKQYLFKISDDIGEKNNLIEEFPEIANSLKKKLAEWDNQNEPARWGWNKKICPNFIGYRSWTSEEQFLAHKNKGKKKK